MRADSAGPRTADPYVVIEERRGGYVRYRNTETGRRWEVHGECVGVGECIIGSVITLDGVPVQVADQAHLAALRAALGPHLGFTADSPVTPEFAGCCEYRFVELARS